MTYTSINLKKDKKRVEQMQGQGFFKNMVNRGKMSLSVTQLHLFWIERLFIR